MIFGDMVPTGNSEVWGVLYSVLVGFISRVGYEPTLSFE